MKNEFHYTIDFPERLHAGIMRRIAAWRMWRIRVIIGAATVLVSLASAALTSRSIGLTFIDNEAADVIGTLVVGAEYNLSYFGYAWDVLGAVLPLETVVVTLANLVIAVAVGWLVISFRKQLHKGRMFTPHLPMGS